MTNSKEPQPNKEESKDAVPDESWLGRAMRGELLSKAEKPQALQTPWPKYCETAYMAEDRTLQVEWSSYGEDGSKMIGGTEYLTSSPQYEEVLR